jgi:hypothetical protein
MRSPRLPRLCCAVFVAVTAAIGLAAPSGAQPTHIISTYAGGGMNSPGDGGQATAAWVSAPYGMAVDAAGNLYIADFGTDRVRRVSAATGIITTVAGNGTAGSTGDGGPATAARIDGPVAVAVDAAGNLYIATYSGNRVRKVAASTGIITTLAGTGAIGYNGDGIPATTANVSYPWGIAVDAAGDVFVAEHAHNRIRRVSASTGLISTYAGTGANGSGGDGGPATQATLASVLGIATDAQGNLYITMPSTNTVRVVTASTGIISTIAGVAAPGGYSGDGGPATAANLNAPYDVNVDAQGNLFIADLYNACIRRVALAAGIITTCAGTGEPGYTGDGGPATAAQLDNPTGVAAGPDGELYISDYANSVIRKVTGRIKPVITWANPADIVYGTALSATQLNATANVAGTFVYDPPAGTLLHAGPAQTLSVRFTPTDTANYTAATATVRINVLKATPVITWTAPDPIVCGMPLSAAQLNAIANVVGTFAYTPPAGTVLNAGIQTLSALFTPSNAADYNTATATVSLTVNKAVPVITWAAPAGIAYGTPLSATQLNATASVAGSFVYSPAAGTVLNAGSGQTLSVTFTPSNGLNYTTAASSVSISVTKATPVITWANPAPITPGTALSATQLNATANVAGSFVYTPPASSLNTPTHPRRS